MTAGLSIIGRQESTKEGAESKRPLKGEVNTVLTDASDAFYVQVPHKLAENTDKLSYLQDKNKQ